MKKLNLGCGTDIRIDCINLDSIALPGVDIVHDLERLPLPFKSEYFNRIYCFNVLEHLDYIPVIREIHRILKKDGTVNIRIPHFTSRFSHVDPTHKKMFSFETFYFFTKCSRFGREYYFDFIFERVLFSRITFNNKIPYNWYLESIINLNDKAKTIYEATFLSRLFPAVDIEIILQK